MKNWKTTVGGMLSALGYVMTSSTEPISHTVGVCLTAVGLLFTGYFASDKRNIPQ